MRTDEQLARKSFRHSRQWATDAFSGQRAESIDRRLDGEQLVDGKPLVHSLSGNERNCLFLNRRGTAFDDLSAVSGLDNPADSRTFVVLDYDRDGWQDVALVNANTPLLNLYRNRIGRMAGGGLNRGGMIALRFEGGSRPGAPAGQWSCRDGYGAVVSVALDGMTLLREHHCGDGYGAQNSATMIVGIGDRRAAQQVSVRWPSGKVSETTGVAAGTLLTVYENPADSPRGAPFVAEAYQRNLAGDVGRPDIAPAAAGTGQRLDLSAVDSLPKPGPGTAKLRMYITMATWCAACKQQMPQVAHLRSALPPGQVDIVGVPIDPDESAEMLADYVAKWQPAYRLLTGLTDAQRASIRKVIQQWTHTEALPCTVITDASGVVILSLPGIPSLSQVRKLLAADPRPRAAQTNRD